MCGFIGLYRDSGILQNDIDIVEKMSEAIEHRGPDDSGIYTKENMIIAFRRLSIIDLVNGHQPYTYDNERYAIIFNGEVYNYKEIREELKKLGYTFTTDSEVEVMLTAFKEYGKECVKMFRGMYAFIILDNEENTIIAGRDIFGIKPLYYREDGDALILSSEQKSFFEMNKDILNINEEGLQNYLTFQYVPENDTILEGTKILEPGSILIKEKGKPFYIEKYFNIELKPSKTEQEKLVREIRDVMEESVAMHMRSDVPVGSFLSGGIDSAIVVALARKHNPNLKTFTIGFDVNGYSEVSLAKEIADHLGVENIERVVSADEYMEKLPEIVWGLDGPMADPSAIPIWFISQEARKHVKVVLSGEGSDELFGGYTIYRESESLKIFNNMPKVLKQIFLKIANKMPEGMSGKSFIERGCTPVEERYVGNANIFKENEKSIYLPKYNPEVKTTQVTKPFFDKVKGADGVIKMQYVDMMTWLRGDILVKSDRMTMAHSLELRVPFLDKEVLRVASKLDRYDKIGNKTTKSLLREAFKDVMPPEVTTRKKLGYPVPIRVWLKNEMYSWAEDIFKRNPAEEFINGAAAIKMLEAHKRGEKDYSRHIFVLLSFVLWYEEALKRNVKFE